MRQNSLSARIQKQEKESRKTRLAIIGSICGLVVLFAAGIKLYFFQAPMQPIVSANTTISTTTPPGPNAYANVSLIGKAAIVYDLTNGQTLYAQNANAQLPLASITKLLTLYAATSVLSPNSTVQMTPLAVSQDGDAADDGFSAGETFKFEDLARLTLAASSNDGAEAIAEAANAERSTNTVSLLASAATSVGLTNTYAVNATGLDESTVQSGGYGSAHDIAVLAGSLLKKAPDIAEATTLPSVSINSEQGVTHSFANTDVDVTHYPNLLLSKTGYTDLAGGNLVIVYDTAINHPVAIVVLGSTENGRFTDVTQLVDATLAHFAGTTPSTTPAK
jgi:D-alanyl-D-alanine carboxypeptidase